MIASITVKFKKYTTVGYGNTSRDELEAVIILGSGDDYLELSRKSTSSPMCEYGTPAGLRRAATDYAETAARILKAGAVKYVEQ